MTFCRMRCVRNCSSVLEFCLSRKSSALQATLVVISPREERGLKALKACTVFRKASSLILERQYHGSLVSESKGGLLRFTRKRQREAVYIKKEDVVGNGLYFEERMFEPSEAKRSVYSLTSNFSSGLVNRKEEEIVGAVHAMVKTGEGSNSVTSQNTILEEVEQLLGSPLSCGSQAPPSKPLVIVISGPSGVGKDAVIKRLQEVRRELHFVVTATTRPKRPGEVDGKDYYFVSKEKFQSMIQKRELLEHAIVYGDYKGIPKQQVRECMAKGIDVVLRVDVQGAATVRSILGSSALFIFLVAESESALVKRLIERKTETKDKLLVRISTARDEVKRMGEFDYVVVNADGQLERAVSLICSILDAEKARVQQRVAQI